MSTENRANRYYQYEGGKNMPEPGEGCVKPSKGPIGPSEQKASSAVQEQKEEIRIMAKVGKEAPDFETSAFYEGAFKNIRLSEFRGKWVILCFYPGDFTFV